MEDWPTFEKPGARWPTIREQLKFLRPVPLFWEHKLELNGYFDESTRRTVWSLNRISNGSVVLMVVAPDAMTAVRHLEPAFRLKLITDRLKS